MDKLIFQGRTFSDGHGVTDRLLMSASAYIGVSLPMVQLAADSLTATVRDYAREVNLLAAGGLLLAAADGVLMQSRGSDLTPEVGKYGDEVSYYHDSTLLGKFRLESVSRTGKYEYRLNCISDIGLLISSNHYGGVYAGITAGALIADIIGGLVQYSIDATLAAVPLYGWLPKASRRDSLLHVLFAIGGQIKKTTGGTITIAPYAEQTPYEITADEFYMGGSVTSGTPASEVDLIEHSFLALPSDETVTLFDGDAAAEELTTPKGKTLAGVLVEFPEPMHDLAAEGATILESDANYAVLSRSPAVVLTGKKYSHTQRRISRHQKTNSTPNVVSSSDCALVNLFNAELVADRLMAYYGSAKTVTADIIVTTQKPGDAVTFLDPFDEETTGYIGSLELTMSSILKGRAELISGFIPPGSGNYYTHVVLLTSGTSWTVPSECRGKIRVVLIGGGQGGESGAQGATATRGTSTSSSITAGTGGAGGRKGAGGAGGNIYVTTLAVAVGAAIKTTFGTGGAGGICTGTENTSGALGTATTFGAYSSADGSPSADGYAELFSGAAYATPGTEGIADGGDGAGRGATSTSITVNGQTYTSGARGEESSDSGTNPEGTKWSGTAYGGYGGGPAYAASGGDGGDGDVEYNQGYGFVNTGNGGAGAAATVAGSAGATYGAGGQGGCGGGGGGAHGGGSSSNTNGIWPGSNGTGGLGSSGGKGGDGCIIIYY